jgi:AraC family transcriptional regulator
MSLRSNYGTQFAGAFHLEPASSFAARYLDKSEVMVTQIRCDHTNNGFSDPLPISDAFLVTTQIRPCQDYGVTVDGKQIANSPLASGMTSIFDLRTSVQVNNISPFRNLHFLLPKNTMAMIAEDNGLAPIDVLNRDPGKTLDDEVIAGLGMALLPSFDDPDKASVLFVDHVTLALAAYVANLFGTRIKSVDGKRFSLSAEQERRAKEMLDANRDGEIRLGDLAADLNLSLRELRVGFRQATGGTPHRWLKVRRVEIALDLIRTTILPLDDIALRAGFRSQQQMEREVRAATGTEPYKIRLA